MSNPKDSPADEKNEKNFEDGQEYTWFPAEFHREIEALVPLVTRRKKWYILAAGLLLLLERSDEEKEGYFRALRLFDAPRESWDELLEWAKSNGAKLPHHRSGVAAALPKNVAGGAVEQKASSGSKVRQAER